MKIRSRIIILLILGASFNLTASAYEKHYGELFMMSGNFCPRGSMPANGASLPIAQNSALFSLLGTKFGGDGRTTFALPNLNGRAPVGVGQGPGMPEQRMGETGGSITQTVKLPAHSHDLLVATSASRNTNDPSGAYVSSFAGSVKAYDAIADEKSMDRRFSSSAISEGGASEDYEFQVDTLQPVLHVSWCITTDDASYPSRG